MAKMNANQLQEALCDAYDTFVGPPRAFIEIETETSSSLRFHYAVYRLWTEADKGSTADYEGRLCDEMHARFMAPLSIEDREDRIATLIWRREVRYRAEPILTGFDEDEANPIDTGRVRHTLSLRAYCPRVARFEEALT